ncbi:hypothetical protein [Brasilonema bromeliae]|uniref:Uncharacterized protein n=1 Tax=Brasilonema bromeliae SPC951 TaxID=385972 RepID=A0ABX1PGJ9_9CYAN|nr:hypothetical protein [Brasilonema bromeliae]NMG23073.1 hypothetical protein [Brasilonema bromeliae SPC951]
MKNTTLNSQHHQPELTNSQHTLTCCVNSGGSHLSELSDSELLLVVGGGNWNQPPQKERFLNLFWAAVNWANFNGPTSNRGNQLG